MNKALSQQNEPTYLKNDDNYAENRFKEAKLEGPLLAKPGIFKFNFTCSKTWNI